MAHCRPVADRPLQGKTEAAVACSEPTSAVPYRRRRGASRRRFGPACRSVDLRRLTCRPGGSVGSASQRCSSPSEEPSRTRRTRQRRDRGHSDQPARSDPGPTCPGVDLGASSAPIHAAQPGLDLARRTSRTAAGETEVMIDYCPVMRAQASRTSGPWARRAQSAGRSRVRRTSPAGLARRHSGCGIAARRLSRTPGSPAESPAAATSACDGVEGFADPITHGTCNAMG